MQHRLSSGAGVPAPARSSAGGPRHAVRPRRRARPAGRRTPVSADRAARLMDVTLAAALLVLLGPLMLLIAALIRATSPGPALFRQARVGYLGRPFVMLKFRTMAAGCGDDAHRDFVHRMLRGEDPRPDGGMYKLTDDPRATPLGRLLRATSLDELPQLINVLRGDMALVGPRPVLPWEAELFQPRHHERFTVKPGITGLWQVSGRCRLAMAQALDLDVAYVRRRSLALDLWILVKTIPAVLSAGGAR